MSIGGATLVCGNGPGQVNRFAAYDLDSALKKKKKPTLQKKKKKNFGCKKKKKKKKLGLKKKKKKKKTFNTRDSLVVPYQSTDRA